MTKVYKAYSGYTSRVAIKGIKGVTVEPASRERWMAVKGLVEAEVVDGRQKYAQRQGMAADFQLNAIKRRKFESDIKAAVNQLFAKEQVQDEKFEDGAGI